jgi:type VI secretion system protein ImpF
MSRIRAHQPLIPSVLDRLLDDESEVGREPMKARHQLLRDIRVAVRRDLENLLNTRRRAAPVPPELKQLKPSMVHYGLPDFYGANLSDPDEREELRLTIERIVRLYEPRFKTVRVELLNNADQLDLTLRFRVNALLHAEPAPEPVTFDSSWQPASGQFDLRGS